MRVADWMTTPAHTVGENTPMDAACQVMAQEGIEHLPVTDIDGQLVGLISRIDLLDRDQDGPVGERMNRDPLAIHPEAPVSVAAAIMRSEDRSAMPVADAGRIVGVLTRSDVLAAVATSANAA